MTQIDSASSSFSSSSCDDDVSSSSHSNSNIATEDSSSSSSEQLFQSVASLLRNNSTSSSQALSDSTRLLFYGYYKQATVGPPPPDDHRPSAFRAVARAKYDAWTDCANLSIEEARSKYVALAASLQGTIGLEVSALLEKSRGGAGSGDAVGDEDVEESSSESHARPSRSSRATTFARRYFPIRPVIPRGRLDLSHRHLVYALSRSFLHSLAPSSSSRSVLLHSIASHFPTPSRIVTGYSVRSLLHLYLTVKSYPRGSEILLCPPIQIPSVIHLLRHHGLVIRPIDVPPDGRIRVDRTALQNSVTSRTVAILLVHPFGLKSLSDEELQTLCEWANARKIEVWEDSAECFQRASQVDTPADVAFYSFGITKTATALGGGIAVIKSDVVRRHMMRAELRWNVQTEWQFAKRIWMASLVLWLGDAPWIVGAIVGCCDWLGLEYDALVTSCLKNIRDLDEGPSSRRWIDSIRKRPCRTLLLLLHHRLSQPSGVKRRIERCVQITASLSRHCPAVDVPNYADQDHAYWLFPVSVPRPERVRRRMLLRGFDVPRGTSQLCCVDGSTCPRAQAIMERILYLPIASREMMEEDVARMISALRESTDCQAPDDDSRDRCGLRGWAWILPVMMLLAIPMFVRVLAWFFVSAVVVLWVCYELNRRYLAPQYLRSKAFVKYNHFRCEPSSDPDLSNFLPLPQLSSSSSSNVVLLTGATGFIGQMILRDLLLHRQQLRIAKVILLVRRRKRQSASERIRSLLSQPFYSFFSNADESIEVVECDLTLPNFGLSDALLSQLKPTHVIHCAASVKFTQSLYDAATNIIAPALQLQSLARVSNAKYVHFSTAFVHGSLRGSASSPLPEEVPPLEEDAMQVYRSMMETQSLASSLSRAKGFRNTYAFAKFVCEHLLLQNDSNTILLRPSIVGPSIAEPHPGWAGCKPSTLVAAACLYLHYPYNLWSFGNCTASVIPVDVVSRFALSKTFHKTTKRIYNVAWDRHAMPAASFHWDDFAAALTQIGSVYEYCSRWTACVTLYIALQSVPKRNWSEAEFAVWHARTVEWVHAALLRMARWRRDGDTVAALQFLKPYLDIPLLFFSYTNAAFCFASELIPPLDDGDWGGERYMMICLQSAERFARTRRRGIGSEDVISIGGRDGPTSSLPNSFVGSFVLPRGNLVLRIGGYLLYRILKRTASLVTIDLSSFHRLATLQDDEHVVLAPTHRSLFDFALLTYACHCIPELGLEAPRIAAAEEFRTIPLLGWLAFKWCGAFFVKRGEGIADPELNDAVRRMKEKEGTKVWEVFLEGMRSRDRRFVRPRTGFLRCLLNTGGKHVVIPIAISYERIPEQSTLTKEADGAPKGTLDLLGLFRWLKMVIANQVNIGRIHIEASPLIPLDPSQQNVTEVSRRIQRLQQQTIRVSSFHIRAGARILDVEYGTIREALKCLGCSFWPTDAEGQESELELPESKSELWTILLQYGHWLAPYFAESHPDWTRWLDPDWMPSETKVENDNEAVRAVVSAFQTRFESAETIVRKTVGVLRTKGFSDPSCEHVLQYAREGNEWDDVPVLLIRAAAEMRSNNSPQEKPSSKPPIDSKSPTISDPVQSDSIVKALFPNPIHRKPTTSPLPSAEEPFPNNQADESFGAWGYDDSDFVLLKQTDGTACISMRGNRYRISGKPLPKLLPFFETELNSTINMRDVALPTRPQDPPAIPSCAVDSDGMRLLSSLLDDRVSTLAADRAKHGTGQTHRDMVLLRSGDIAKSLRLPDVVVYPHTEEEIVQIVSLALERNWCLIPYGGGTNVSHATQCPSLEDEPRPVISVDVKCLKRVRWVKEDDGVACVEAGITGSELAREMSNRGLTIGHEPDSIEFSTLGGWIATKASGMKRNKYGNIEDLLVNVRIVGPNGVMWQHRNFERVSTGFDATSLALGSEGCMGIITCAVIRVWPLAECEEFECVLLPSFEDGIRFCRDTVAMMGASKSMPASVRLLDNDQFRLGRAMAVPPSSTLERVRTDVAKLLFWSCSVGNKMSPKSVVAATIAYEGRRDEVAMQKRQIATLAKRHGGWLAGPEIGRSGYDLTFVIAYLRDFAMTYYVLGESFETYAPWSKLEDLVECTKARIREEHRRRALPGRPFVSCRISQIYDGGVCVYFYVCMNLRNVPNPSDVFEEIENVARKEILERGGSLSHHHGVGKLRAPFMGQVNSEYFEEVLRNMKDAYDPNNVFGARNGVFCWRRSSSKKELDSSGVDSTNYHVVDEKLRDK